MSEYISGWRSLTQEQVNTFGTISGGDGRIHTDPEYAGATQFGAPLVQGLYLVALTERHLVDLEPRWAAAGRLQATFVRPVTVGEDFAIEAVTGPDGMDMAVRTSNGQAITGTAGIKTR